MRLLVVALVVALGLQMPGFMNLGMACCGPVDGPVDGGAQTAPERLAAPFEVAAHGCCGAGTDEQAATEAPDVPPQSPEMHCNCDLAPGIPAAQVRYEPEGDEQIVALPAPARAWAQLEAPTLRVHRARGPPEGDGGPYRPFRHLYRQYLI
jgi:hypothetical protein